MVGHRADQCQLKFMHMQMGYFPDVNGQQTVAPCVAPAAAPTVADTRLDSMVSHMEELTKAVATLSEKQAAAPVIDIEKNLAKDVAKEIGASFEPVFGLIGEGFRSLQNAIMTSNPTREDNTRRLSFSGIDGGPRIKIEEEKGDAPEPEDSDDEDEPATKLSIGSSGIKQKQNKSKTSTSTIVIPVEDELKPGDKKKADSQKDDDMVLPPKKKPRKGSQGAKKAAEDAKAPAQIHG